MGKGAIKKNEDNMDNVKRLEGKGKIRRGGRYPKVLCTYECAKRGEMKARLRGQ